MENASKALIIAGGIVVAVLIISLLVVFFNNLRGLQGTQAGLTEEEQAVEFNKQFEVYDRDNIYGSDILSLANKVVDYNLRESDKKGYQEMKMSVTFKTAISGFEKNTTYTSEQMKEIVTTLDTDITSFGGYTYSGKKVRDLANMRTNERLQWYTDKGISQTKQAEIENYITKYTQRKAEQVEIKGKIFKCTKIDYDSKTGRIINMTFETN
ncbi:MAG: hypothetical protein ACLU84_00290 [Clostridia bacterium]